MRVLVATSRGQGGRANDFSFCEEGEPVHRGSLCTNAAADDECGCARSLVGCRTLKSTTTARVVDFPGYGLAALAADIRGSLERGGWYPPGPEVERAFAAEATHMADIAARFAIGDVVEYRDGRAARRAR